MIDRSFIRNKSIGVKVTEADFARLQTLAEAQGRPMGKWWRRIILTVGHGREPGVALREWELALTHGPAHLSKRGCGASSDSSTESRGDGRS